MSQPATIISATPWDPTRYEWGDTGVVYTGSVAEGAPWLSNVTGVKSVVIDTRSPLEQTLDALTQAGAELADAARAWHTAWNEPPA
jgi:hypothetical protein